MSKSVIFYKNNSHYVEMEKPNQTNWRPFCDFSTHFFLIEEDSLPMISTWCKIHSFCLLPSLPPENQPNTQRFICQTLVRTKALKSNIRTSAAKNIQDGSIQTAAECDMPDNKPPAIVLPVRHKVVCTILSDSATRLFFASIQTNTLKYQIHQYQIGPWMYLLPF